MVPKSLVYLMMQNLFYIHLQFFKILRTSTVLKNPKSLLCFRAVSKTVGPSKIIKLLHSSINTIAERTSCVSSNGCCSTHYRYIYTSLFTTVKLPSLWSCSFFISICFSYCSFLL